MTFLLTKIFLKSSMQKIIERNGLGDAKKRSKAQITLYILLFAYLIGLMWFLSTKIIDMLREINQEAIFIDLILMMVFFIGVIQAIFSSINLLYFSKDTDALLSLPLKPHQIILARTNVMLIIEFAVNMLVGFIPLVIYGVKLNCGALYYISTIVSLILLPILPVILISLLAMLIMSFSKITKNKNRFQLFSTLLVLALVIAFSIGVTKLDSSTITDEEVTQALVGAGGTANMIKGYFPTLDYLANAIHSNNILTMLIEFIKTIGITILGLVIYVLLAQKLYFKGLIGILYSSGKSKKKNIKIKSKSRKLGYSYILKEFKILFRNPVFLVQCVLPAILFPILILIIVFMSSGGESNDLINTLPELIKFNKPLILMGLVAITQMFSMLIYVSITAISRDGQNANFIKYIPVSLYKQYVYKIIPNVIMNIFSTLIVLIAAKYLVNIEILDLGIVFIVSTLMIVFLSTLCLIMDLKRPKLQWNSEYAVVKQNMNLVFPMIFGTINMGVTVFVNSALSFYNAYIQLGIMGGVYLLANILVNIYLYKKQYELSYKII